MPTLQQLGGLKLTSPTVVVTDPGYDEDTATMCGLGCFITPCKVGQWYVELTMDMTPQRRREMPRTVTAVCDGFAATPDSPDWQRKGHVGGDGGVLGIYDSAHFHDASIVPEEQEWTFNGEPAISDDLWYSFICELLRDRAAVVVPYGITVHWDGGMDVDAFSVGNKVVAIRMSISGWPDGV